MGAPQNRLLELACELKELGWDIEIVAALPNYPTGKIFPEYRGKIYARDTVKDIAVHRYWLYPSKSTNPVLRILSMLSFSFSSFFAWWKLRNFRPDIIMVESPPLTLAVTGLLLARLTRSRLIMNVSDLWPMSAKELGAVSDGFFYRMLTRLEAFLYRHSDICTGQSQEIVDHIGGVKNDNVWLLRNGVDISRFTFQSTVGRNYTLVYAGLLGVAQGVADICNNINFKELGLELHIYGSGNEKEKIEEYLKANPNKGITYKGMIGRDDIPGLLTKYDAALIPLVRNIYGAVPSKIYEAMAAGLPIMFSGAGEGARIVRDHNTGWVNTPSDWEMLRLNLKKFRNISGSELFVFKEQARAVAEKYFDRKAQVRDFHTALTSVYVKPDE